MNDDQFQILAQLLHHGVTALQGIEQALVQLIPDAKEAPNLTKPLEEFPTFDWSSINVEVVRSDQYGAAIVAWRGQHYVRRSPTNKFTEALWFSRCTGKNEDGTNLYERLITFKSLSKIEVDPLPTKVSQHLKPHGN